MGSTEIKSKGTVGSTIANVVNATNTGMVDVGDIGDALATTEVLMRVGGAGEPEAIWITSIYANASTAGMLYFFHVDDGAFVAFAEGDAKCDYAIYIPVGGAGITDVNIGPIREDLCVCRGTAGTYINTRAGEILVTYDYV